MVRPLRFARSLAPKLVVGGLCAALTASSFAGGGGPIPPCSPDGVCLPRYETWGWYETRWRPFPGDSIAGTPTEAQQREAAEGDDRENLGGPQLPSSSQETQIGPEKPARSGARAPAPTLPSAEGAGPAIPAVPEGAGAVPAPEGGVLPGDPAGEGVAPPVDAVPQPGPGALPETTPSPIDPFGASPPAPPSWMVEQTSFEPLPPTGNSAPADVVPLPPAEPVNLESDDAPPELPTGLQALLGPSVGRPAWSATSGNAVVLAQPVQVRPAPARAIDRGVVQTSAEAPLGIQLINPASAIAPAADESGLQQAIYFEASDQGGDDSLALPPVAPAN
jgi:hypothetical protein